MDLGHTHHDKILKATFILLQKIISKGADIHSKDIPNAKKGFHPIEDLSHFLSGVRVGTHLIGY